VHQVFGSKDSPRIKLCDFGCAKKRSDEPRYGPASGTKDWQAPEQMAAPQNDDEDMDEGPPGNTSGCRLIDQGRAWGSAALDAVQQP